MNQLKRFLKRSIVSVPGVRAGWHLCCAAWQLCQDPESTASYFDRLFITVPDPWDYRGDLEQARFNSALKLIDSVGVIRTATEVGCAEGLFTESLRHRCDSLTSLDFSEVALERARQSFAHDNRIHFRLWNLRTDEMPAACDLVVCMCVVESLRRRSDFIKAREKVISGVNEGGYLLLGHSRQSAFHENTIWGKWLLRDAKWIHQFFAGDPRLELISVEVGAIYLNALFKRRSSNHIVNPNA